MDGILGSDVRNCDAIMWNLVKGQKLVINYVEAIDRAEQVDPFLSLLPEELSA